MREQWIDEWKGLLILLVVLGHVAGGGAHLTSGSGQVAHEGIYRVIYLFHMPAFFAVAGSCWKGRTGGVGVLSFIAKKTRRLLVPYFSFGIVSIVLYLLLENVFLDRMGAGVSGYYLSKGAEIWWRPFVSLLHAGGWPNGEGFRANTPLWFLPCLFSVEFVYLCIDRYFPQKWMQLGLSFGCVLIGFLFRHMGCEGLPWGMGKVPYFLAFVVWGRWLFRPLSEVVAGGRIRIKVLTCLVAWGYVSIGWCMPSQWFSCQSLFWYLVFVILAIAGTACSLGIVRLFPSCGLSRLGMASLSILLVHKFFVMFFQAMLPVVRWGYSTGALMSVFMTLAVVVFVLIGCGLSHWILRKYAPLLIGIGLH